MAVVARPSVIPADSEPLIQQQQQQPNQCQKGRKATSRILTASINLLKLQMELKPILNCTFEFRITRNVINVVTKEVASYLALMR
jgi:hypothetical protein